MEKNQPEKKIKAGPIRATIWLNKGQNKEREGEFEFRTISLERVYKDKEGSWQNTTYLRINDLPKAAIVLQKAYEYLVLNGQETN